MKIVSTIIASFLLIGCTSAGMHPPEKVLFVVTSHDTIEKAEKFTGAFASEITHPYQVLSQGGYEIDFVSPQGGETPLDGVSTLDESSKALLESAAFKQKLHNALHPEQVQVSHYAAIYYAGGHGTMFDLPQNEKLQKITARIYEEGGVVGAVCHGPAGLVNVRLSSGEYLVAGKQVSSFTNEEEEAVKLTEAMPFLLESKLVERGAIISKTSNFQKRVVVSDRLVTGQNPASAEGVAEEMLRLLDAAE